ncbi:MAG: NHL repeat-containing protein [Phycisphaerae bacterium]
MRGNWAAISLCAVLGSAARPAGVAVPESFRIPATIVRTIEPPPDQPMRMPTDVAVDSQGRIYVVDGANDRVVCFRPDGRLDRVLNAASDVPLKQPVGISVDAQDRVWIADSGNGRVLAVLPDGQLDQTAALPTAEAAKRPDPTDVAVSPDGARLYVVDNDNHRLLVRDNANGQWKSLGGKGRGLGRFQWPFMICIGADGYVFVTEVIGARVQRLSPDDRWAGALARWGVQIGQLYRPKGIAADATGKLYVSDSTLGVIQRFRARGEVDGVLTAADGSALQFQHPMGLCFDGQGRLLVVELGANRIAVVAILSGTSGSDEQKAGGPKDTR